jgi:hypothetical protein
MKPWEKLTPEEKSKRLAETDLMMRAAIDPIRTKLGADYNEVIGFLEANEFELALDHVVGTLVEENIAVPPPTVLALKRIAERMKLDSSSVSMQGIKKIRET